MEEEIKNEGEVKPKPKTKIKVSLSKDKDEKGFWGLIPEGSKE